MRLLLLMLLAGAGACARSEAAPPGGGPKKAACGQVAACGAGQFCFRNTVCQDKLPTGRFCDGNEDCTSGDCPVIEGSCIGRTGFVVACKDNGPCSSHDKHGCTLPQKTCK